MRCVWRVVAALAVGPAVPPAHAHAQPSTTTTPAAGTGTIGVRLLRIDDEVVNTLSPRPLNVEDCAATAPRLEFELDRVPSSKATVDVYSGSESSQCNLKERDNATTSTCEFVDALQIEGRTKFSVKIDAGSLCGSGSGKLTLWFLAVNASRMGEDVGSDFGTEAVVIDTDPPGAPTQVEGGAGERQIPVAWEADDKDIERFVVYIDGRAMRGSDGSDGGTSSDGACSSTRLVEGAAIDDIPASVKKKTVEGGTATDIDLNADDIGGDFAAVAVVAVDKAGNPSPLSGLACVEVVPTQGFWERYEHNGGAANSGCAVRRVRGGAARGSVGSALTALFALAAFARSRRRRA